MNGFSETRQLLLGKAGLATNYVSTTIASQRKKEAVPKWNQTQSVVPPEHRSMVRYVGEYRWEVSKRFWRQYGFWFE